MVANVSAAGNRKFPHRVIAKDIQRRRPILNLIWTLTGFLKFTGLALALGGVAMFGWYFVRANARAARKDDAPVAWGGAGAMNGVKILGLGLGVQLLAFVLILLLPGRM